MKGQNILSCHIKILFSYMLSKTSGTQGSHRDHTGITQGSHRDHTGITQGSHRDHTGCLFLGQVRRILKVLEKPFSTQPGLEEPGRARRAGRGQEAGAREEGAQEEAGPAPRHPGVPYDSKPPVWASEICVT